jgi:hypothetical protein
MDPEHDFYFDGTPVGAFEEPNMPLYPGRYRYGPYRGPGHYLVGVALKAGDHPRCYYDRAGIRISFSVSSIPEYGNIELCDFRLSGVNHLAPNPDAPHESN